MKYTIGIDFGSLSCRALLVDVNSGEELSSAVYDYSNGVIDERLPHKDIKLSYDWSLQDPDDYLRGLEFTVKAVLSESKINKADVIGLAIDFTSCTMLPVAEDQKALCQHEEFRDNPHSWIKLWKHHAAQPEANFLNETAKKVGEDFLKRYGGKISSEWFMPKIMQILNEDEEIYDNSYAFMEATDWVTMQLTGNWVRNTCTSGYKNIWHKQKGYPSKEFYKALHPKLQNIVEEKFKGEMLSLGDKAGNLTEEMAKKLGLTTKVTIAVGNVDAHVSAPPSMVTEPGKMLMIMGTSTCDILIGESEQMVEGMCGVVEDGVIPGTFGYESGQSAVGDIFGWFVDNCVPESYYKEAKNRGINIHVLLEEKAAKLKAGESGLVALDWLNGNRSILVDVDLTGLIMGMTLATKPEEIYRALIEATAFGKRVIIEAFNKSNVPVNELVACGGLPNKNKMLMQIYADVTGLKISVAKSEQTPALGAAMFAAVAAGKENGGYDSIYEASEKMGGLRKEFYIPIKENQEVYSKIYKEYKILHDLFGKENNMMKRLKAIKKEVTK